MSQYNYIYLHGFASNPASSKAQYFKQKLEDLHQEVIIPDLNLDDFSSLTLSRQLDQVGELVSKSSKPVIMFGSSMGGLTTAILAEKYPNIAKIILLAPAFAMSSLWGKGNPEELDKWKSTGETLVMHYGYNQQVPLKYNFYTDLFKHDDINFKRQIPALIFHGIHDDVVPLKVSQMYAHDHKMAQLIELDDDHSVGADLDSMWEKIKEFCSL